MSAIAALERYGEARAVWLQLEELAGGLGDDELTMRVDTARLAILDVRDRLEQLHLAELEVGWPDEAAA